MGRCWYKIPIVRTGSRTAPALLAIALLLPLGGCATWNLPGECETYATGPAPCDACALNTPAWGGVSNVFGTPTWTSPTSVFGTPAYGMPPSIYGNRLQVPPGESAAARVMTLTDQLAASKSENEQLTNRIRGLESDVESGNKALSRATREVAETRAELANTRADLEQWRQEIAAMREKLEAADKDNLSTLQTTIGLLQKMLAEENPSAN